MQVRKTFMSVWKNNYNVLSLSLCSLILVVVEEIMEMEFKCPREESLKKWLVVSYFLCPALITFFLSLYSKCAYIPWAFYTRKYSCFWKIEKISQVVLPPLIWCMILLCDGRYIGCVTSGNEGNSSQSKAAEFPSKAYIISQVSGLFLLTGVVILYGVYHMFTLSCFCNCEERQQRDAMESLLEKEVRKQIEEMKKVGAEQIIEQKVKTSLQHVVTRFWNSIDLRKTEELRGIVQYAFRVIGETREQAVEQSLPLKS